MLLWFPTLYPDELLYSVFARYHVRSGNTSHKATTEELFGRRTIRSVLDLPAHLNTLLDRMDSNIEADDLIFNHTTFPYFAAFLLPKQAVQVKESMKGNKGSTIHTRIGMAASNVKPKTNLWVCSDCIDEDMNNYGETYWHRIHQIPGVYFCPKHHTVLEETNLGVKAGNQHEYVIATPTVERTKVNLDGFKKEELDLLLKISQITQALLSNTQVQTKSNTLKEKYQSLLKQKGLVSLNGFLKREKLYENFLSRFSDSLLELLQSPVVYEETNWLTMIFQKHRKSFHPIRHILVMMFLETDLNDLFELEEYYPFQKGPWLCLNPVCQNYHKRVVTSLTITRDYKTGCPVGTFRCDCGFVYSRKGPDQNEQDSYRIGTIKKFGHVWKEKLAQMVNAGDKLSDIAKKMQADSATVKKYAVELGLKISWKKPKNKKKNTIELLGYEDQIAERRSKWQEFQKVHPEKSKTELRKMAPDAYTFLYRHDREWLNKFSPVVKKVQSSYSRVDWEKRDQEILKMVKKVTRTWDENVEKPTRITISAIGKRLNRLSLFQKSADNLPNTVNYIKKIEEDIRTYQKRRIEFHINKLAKENEPITESDIYRIAGLRRTVSNEVKRFITLKVTEYETLRNNY
jgi:hypothetical protein